MKIEKQLCKYIILNVFAMIGTSCYILADTYFISNAAGTDGITALNLTLPIYGLIFAIGAMIGIGSAIRYSLCKNTERREADRYFSNAVIWDIILGLLFTAVGITAPELVMRFMGADEEIMGVGTPYLRIALIFTPFFMMNYTFTAFVRNDKAPKLAMAATLLSSIFNIVFDYIFMFPLGLGMVGAALATGVSPIVSILICLTHFFSKKNSIRFRLALPSIRMLAKSCSLGVVAFVGEIASGITTMAFNFILLGLAGNTAVAAYGVVANYALVGTAIFNGVSQGLQPLASEMHGKGDGEAQKMIIRCSTIIGLILAFAIVGGVWMLAKPCVQVFNGDNSRELADYAVRGIRIYFAGFLAASINIIWAGYFSATGRAMPASIVALSRGVIAIILFAFVLSRVFGITGVWLAFPCAEVFTLGITFILKFYYNCSEPLPSHSHFRT